MAIAAAIPLAGKLLPFLAKAGSAANLPLLLRGAGGLAGATPGLMSGDLGQAILGGGLGAASTLGLGGLSTKAAGGLSNLAMGGLKSAGMATIPGMAAAVPTIASAAVPAAIGLGAGGFGAGLLKGPASSGAERALGMGAGMGRTPNVPLGGAQTVRISPEHIRMGTGPDGGVFYELDPRGLKEGLRVGSGLDTRQNISNQNAWYNAMLPQWDEIEKRKQERAIQNAQISSNIALARQLSGNRQIADLNIAQDQSRAMGNMFANTAVPTLAM
jgi:hypothetical protein